MKKILIVVVFFILEYLYYRYYFLLEDLNVISVMLYDTNYLLTVSINMYDVILMIGFILFHLTILYYYLKDIFDSSSFMNLIRYRKTKLDFLISIITTNIKKSIILSVSIFFIICIIGCIENYGIHYFDTYILIWKNIMMYIIISLSYINAILKNNDKKILIIFYLVIISLLNIDLSLGTHFIIFSGIWSIEICYLVVYMFLIILPIVIRLKGRKKSDKSYKCE